MCLLLNVHDISCGSISKEGSSCCSQAHALLIFVGKRLALACVSYSLSAPPTSLSATQGRVPECHRLQRGREQLECLERDNHEVSLHTSAALFAHTPLNEEGGS